MTVMALPVLDGALLSCSMGVTPSSLTVVPTPNVRAESRPWANITDHKPMTNIATFGLCSSLLNPVTASQTSAASGVLTPGTCTPMTSAPWTPGSPSVRVGGSPALTDSCRCLCSYGGTVTVTLAGATVESVS